MEIKTENLSEIFAPTSDALGNVGRILRAAGCKPGRAMPMGMGGAWLANIQGITPDVVEQLQIIENTSKIGLRFN